jgi:group I intron endonuclease
MITKSTFDVLRNIVPVSFELPLENSDKFQNTVGEFLPKGGLGKAGVYVFTNKINGFCYVGSSIQLANRLKHDYLENKKGKGTRKIDLAFKEFDLDSFNLDIYVIPETLISEVEQAKTLALLLEQYYILLLNPEYNMLKIAGSSFGRVFSEESIEKMRTLALGRKHSEQVKKLMSESRKGVNNNFYGKKHTIESIDLIRTAALKRTKLNKPGIEVEITDLETKLTTTYESIRKAANAINSDIKSLSRREKSQLEKGINTPYRGRYMIVFKRS